MPQVTEITGWAFGTAPLEEDGKSIVLTEPETGNKFLIPFGKEALDRLVAELSLSNEELQEQIEREKALAEAVANNGHGET